MNNICINRYIKISIIFLITTCSLGCGRRIKQPEYIDYATVDYRDDWLHHPVIGDPSFDTFERSLRATHLTTRCGNAR